MARMRPTSVVLFHNPDKPDAVRALPVLRAWFRKRGVRVLPPARVSEARLAVALGGDGTLLSAARRTAPLGIPVLGVNLGRLGFLAAADLSRAAKTLNDLLAGRLPLSSRLMLEARGVRGPARLALNDVVVRGRNTARVIGLSVRVDGEDLGTFVGDGLIVSTPTGSTAYSLAASGPIVEPEMDLFLLTPICPHSFTQRPVVLSPDSVVQIFLKDQGRDESALVSMDGQRSFVLSPGQSVTVRRAEARFHIFSDPRRPYFSLLREKLKWGER